MPLCVNVFYLFLPLLGVDSCWLSVANFDSAVMVGEDARDVRELDPLSVWGLLAALEEVPWLLLASWLDWGVSGLDRLLPKR